MFGRWLMRQEDGRGGYLLDVNPLDRVEAPRRPRTTRPHMAQGDVARFVLLAVPEYQDLARMVLLSTTLRASEICNLDVSDLLHDEATGKYSLRVRLKGDRPKVIAIPDDVAARLLAALERRQAKPRATDPLLLNSRGERWGRTALSESFVAIGKRAGVKIRTGAHAWRHSANVLARRVLKMDVQQRAALLNHAGTATLNRYDHEDVEEGRETRDAFWDAVKGLGGNGNGK
jgi:integrase